MGNVDPNFTNKINGAFLCVVASLIQHSLIAWQTGTLDNHLEEYTATRSSCAHARMTATWALYPTRVSTFLIGFIKTKLNNLVVKEHGIADEEPVDPAALHSGDHKDLEKYLKLQLQKQIDKHKTIATDIQKVADLPS
ncbi:hypothetical protein DFH27DRAFT_616812 [Peziza echinospora]|nr:hypothetical protein DFH27DRAFT_616812 [Peziza echinospora]